MKKPIVAPGGIPRIAGLIVPLGVIALGAFYGLPLAVLGLATAALVLVVALLWASVSSLAGETELSLDEALSYGAPSAEEEQKLAVLRALTDLEFERSVGTISEEDYREFSGRYRAEAKRIIARVDDYLIETMLTTVLAFGAYLVAERFHVSGVLATVAAGIVTGNLGLKGMSPTTRIVLFNFWEFLAFVANSLVFLLIGFGIDMEVQRQQPIA